MKLIMVTKEEHEENKLFTAKEALDRLPWKSGRSLVRNIKLGKLKAKVIGEGRRIRYFVHARDIEDFWQRGGKPI